VRTTKPFLTFAIPTWNRQREVEVCIRSIAEQTKHQIRRITILVQDDASTDGTKESVEALQKEFPELIDYRRREVRTDYADAFRDLFLAPDAEWVWTFGDDDMLLPGALDVMMKTITDTDCEFIHCAERGREAGSRKHYRGKLLQLCNTFGWLDMTGFITCNVVRGDRLRDAARSPRWPKYAKSAFVQSCALLEVLKDAQCSLMDVPLVATQNETQTQECVDRWAADKIGERYMLVADCIEKMFDDGILTEKLRFAFFRYQNYHLWDRHITYFVDDYLTKGMLRPAEHWSTQSRLSQFVGNVDGEVDLGTQIEGVRAMLMLHAYLSSNLEGVRQEIQALSEKFGQSVYPWAYVVPVEPQQPPKQQWN
jgi:glycosyltransferase involved in cell wall biosynthesis